MRDGRLIDGEHYYLESGVGIKRAFNGSEYRITGYSGETYVTREDLKRMTELAGYEVSER